MLAVSFPNRLPES